MEEKETLETETDELVNDSPEEEQETSEKPDEEQTSEKTEKTDNEDKNLKSALAQKEHFRKKFEALKAETEKAEKEKEEKKEQPKEADKPSTEEKVDQIDFLVKHKDVPPEAMTEISAYARGAGVSLEEALESKPIQAWLKAEKEKSRKEEATPAPSSRTDITVDGKSFKEMSEAERTTNFGNVWAKLTKEGEKQTKGFR